MNEKQLIAAICHQLPRGLHRQSMTYSSLSYNGTPDRYFDGRHSDLWVEFKMLKAMPRSNVIAGGYTALQREWMERRWYNGGNVVGVVGLPNRTAAIQRSPLEWRNGTPVATAISLKDVALWIIDYCGLSCALSAVF